MQVRRAGADDLELVTTMRLALLTDGSDGPPAAFDEDLRRATAAFVRAEHSAGRFVTWLAEVDDECVGVVSLLLQPLPPLPADRRRHDAVVLNMYVRPGHRRRGVARALLDACLAGAAGLDVRRVALVATPSGRPLYEQVGFAVHPDRLDLGIDPPG